MKYALTLVHHLGEDGNAPEGRILHMSDSRFDEIGPDGSGLVREATKEEIAVGYVPPFVKDETAGPEVSAAADPASTEKAAPQRLNKKAPEPSNKAG